MATTGTLSADDLSLSPESIMIDRLPEFAISRIEPDDNGCWLWAGSIDKHGYGRWGDHLAHRRVYDTLRGDLPEWVPTGQELDHLCRTRRCVNPDHLEVVARRVNVLRGESFTAKNAVKTHCPSGHRLAGDNLIASRLPHRACRTCHLEVQARWRERQRVVA